MIPDLPLTLMSRRGEANALVLAVVDADAVAAAAAEAETDVDGEVEETKSYERGPKGTSFGDT